ncbi:hypothetical protein JCM17846_13070 [Iodidimonas nitroreducens]|uniref:Response regulatory domain-containing protein n=1 Tax=Iodidimonas nitroreducens TaxID=1236968 RepID=A0A5A7N7K7_9PROT|nr:hypothetical protein [Iodidimonas nitroreducens]GER03625.1 hypothetical protein JCM17846_13070 [Iodidimonas nitroreducens]
MAKILLAEDEDSVREFVRRGLVGHGYEVKATADGGEALELWPMISLIWCWPIS